MNCAKNNDLSEECIDNKNVKINQVIMNNLTRSTIHAIPNIFSPNDLILKIMWLICFLGSGSFCSFFIVTSIQEYLSFDVVSKIDIRNENPIVFPAVSICNLNIFSSLKSHFIMNKLMKNNTSIFQHQNISSKSDLMSLRYKYQINSLNLNISEKKSLGNKMDDVIISCIFDWEDCSLNDDFFELF